MNSQIDEIKKSEKLELSMFYYSKFSDPPSDKDPSIPYPERNPVIE